VARRSELKKWNLAIVRFIVGQSKLLSSLDGQRAKACHRIDAHTFLRQDRELPIVEPVFPSDIVSFIVLVFRLILDHDNVIIIPLHLNDLPIPIFILLI
jgi:hypothetical protein